MYDITLVQTLGTIVVAAAVALLLARLIQAPAIVAFLVAGVVLGPVLHVLPTEHDGHGPLEIVSELGIVLLLFLVGLELSLDKIKAVGKVAVAAGLGQVIFTIVGGLLFTWLLGFSLMECIFIATALTFSSTVVVVKVLDQKGDLDSLYGRIAVGIFLVQDLVVIVVLTALTGMTVGAGDEAAQIQGFDAGALAWAIARAFAGMLLLAATCLAVARWLLPRPIQWAARSPRTMVIWSLCWCLLVVELAAIMQLSLEIGAFLAGLSLAQLPASHDLRRRVHPLMNFFVAVFFVSLGAQMELTAAAEHWKAAVVLSLFVLIGNPFIFMWIIARFGYSERTCFFTSVTVAQISEFSFILAAMGVTAGLIDPSILSLTAVVGLITIIGSVYMILYSDWLYAWYRRMKLLAMFRAPSETAREARHEAHQAEHGPFSGHVVVVGMNAMGRSIVRALAQRGLQVVAIDVDPHKLADLPGHHIVGDADYRSVLAHAGLSDAELAVTTLQIDDVNDLFVHRCKKMGVPVAAHLARPDARERLEAMGADYLIDSKAAASELIESRLRKLEVVSE